MKIEGTALSSGFFADDAQRVARRLLGKVLCHRLDGMWLAALIVETEAYYRREKASHASLGYTEKRKALFMAPGTIYMYYARGGDSFNVSCRGAGNAVLFKAAIPYLGASGTDAMLDRMRRLNALPSGRPRALERLCAGQTLLCRALGLRVPEWDGRGFCTERLLLLDLGYRPRRVIRTARLGIPPGRDGHLPYRYIDYDHAASSTKNPLNRGKPLPPAVEILTQRPRRAPR